jgi:hypothetical protein
VTAAVRVQRRRISIAAALLATSVSCASSPPPVHIATAPGPVGHGPFTRAERTAYRETSTYADVMAFIDTLRRSDAPLTFGSIGRTTEGRDIPYVIASRPMVRTPAGARSSGKPIVYVQANIHAGEVEGKEALLSLVRDLAFARAPNVLDSIVLIAVPIYNADGNERFGPQERQRAEQNGPELVGQRPNAMNLDLNRDYIKAEAPETRASLAMLNAWDPDVFVDLHTTDGSFHGYALTYSPSLSPAAPLGNYTRALLAELRNRVRVRDGYETFDYGNFEDPGGEVSTDTVHGSWNTYDARPRFGTNYVGLRNRISVLSEAFSHDPFERRVRSTYAFTRELLSLVAENGRGIRLQEQQAEAPLVGRGAVTTSLRSVFPATTTVQPVRYEILARTGDTVRREPGVPRGLRRTGELRTRSMPVFDRFVAVRPVSLPAAYLLPAADTTLVNLLRAHGIALIRTNGQYDTTRGFDAFTVDSIGRAPRVFQGHHEIRLSGRWAPGAPPASQGPWYFVDMHQPLALLAAYLLDPESEDGFTTWNLFDASLAVGQPYPVMRRLGH